MSVTPMNELSVVKIKCPLDASLDHEMLVAGDDLTEALGEMVLRSLNRMQGLVDEVVCDGLLRSGAIE